MYKKAMYILLIMSMGFNFNIYAKTSKDTPGTAIFVMAETKPIQVETKEFIYQSPEINLTIQVPQVKGLSDKNFEKSLNKNFINEGKSARDSAIKTAKEYNKDLVKDGLTPLKFEYSLTYSVIDSPPRYLVLSFLDYQYSGGAHGISHQRYINIDTYMNTILELKDLFKENKSYISLINDEIKSQIQSREKKGDYFFSGTEGFTTITEKQIYYINKEGNIVIVFNVYEIAPYAAGVIEFTIPKEDLASYLK